MPIEYQMTAICDRCGKIIEGPVKVKVTKIQSTRWGWEHKWKGTGILKREYFKRTPSIWCQPCADGVGPKLT